jgi:protein-tyrosine phosphatase
MRYTKWLGVVIIVIGAIVMGTMTGAQAERPVRLAFVDTGNTGRSVTADALAHAAIARQGLAVQVISRAVNFNPYNIAPEANFVSLLFLRGIDVTGHKAVQFDAQDAKFSDVILTMTKAHKDWVIQHFPDARDRVFTLTEYAGNPADEVADAFGKPLDFYQAVLAQLDPLILAAVTKAAGLKP